MKSRKRNIVFKVSTTRTYKSEDPSPGKETWDSADTTSVLAFDAEDAIARVRDHLNREDKADGCIKRRVAIVFGSVVEAEEVEVV